MNIIILLCLTFTVFIFAVRLIGNRPHFLYNLGRIVRVTVKIELGFASYNYATVTSTIIPKLYSNVGDYLYIFHSNSCIKLYLFYTSYSYNSISRYMYRGISAHIPRRDLVIFACCVVIDYH